jgi:hypothetical protein
MGPREGMRVFSNEVLMDTRVSAPNERITTSLEC